MGLPYSSSSILVIAINGGGLPFRLITPLFSDRFGPLNAVVPVSLAWTITAFCWLAVSNVPGMFVWTVVYGGLSGAFQCLTPTTVASITPSLDKVGVRMGM